MFRSGQYRKSHFKVKQFCVAILDKRGLDHNLTQFITKQQATLQLALCLETFTSFLLKSSVALSILFAHDCNYLSAKNFAKYSTILFHYLNALGNLAKDWYHRWYKFPLATFSL